jgi:hypothetical protein
LHRSNIYLALVDEREYVARLEAVGFAAAVFAEAGFAEAGFFAVVVFALVAVLAAALALVAGVEPVVSYMVTKSGFVVSEKVP